MRVPLVAIALVVLASGCAGDDGGSAPAGSDSGNATTGDSAVGTTDAPATGDTAPDGSTDDGRTGSSVDDDGSTGDDATTDGESSGANVSCNVVGVAGDCDDVTMCGEGSTPFGGICDDVPSVQCCVPVSPPCSVDGAPGLCMDVDVCPSTTTPGLCPGDATVQCCTDPSTACDPDAMPLPNEGLSEQSWDPDCPDGMVRSDGFCIDRFEAALVELNAAGAEVGSWSPFFNPGATPVRAISAAGAVPQGHINQVQAAAACDEAGKRLCTDTEWLRACQGATGSTYPYGDALEPGRCNDARDAHPVIEYFGTTEDWIWSELGHPCISQIPASLDITGLNADCESEDGAVDMMGNLHEWTADPAGTFRGGFFVDTVINGSGCQYATTAHDVQHWDYSTGFRCCADG